MASRPNPPKKVRLACRRCRARRIKCDGQTPACTNCAKAGQVCLDVDSQNSNVLIPRNFAGAARARISWLEDIIRDRLPDIDLKQGPQVDSLAEVGGTLEANPDGSFSMLQATGSEESPGDAEQSVARQASQRGQLKRSAEISSPSDHRESFPEQAHSVAVNLGMLSLNSDSPQKHYLGSSSGLLFTHLIGASPSSTVSTTAASIDASADPWHDDSLTTSMTPSRYASYLEIAEQELPKKADAVLLVRTYIRSLHPDYPVLEPASILAALEALYSCLPVPVEGDPLRYGWPSSVPPFMWNGRRIDPCALDAETVPFPVIAFIMFMIFNTAAIVRVRSRVYDHPPDKFYAAAMRFASACFSKITLSSIQALVMLVVHSMLTPAEINLWTLVHVALAHCVELGIHRRPHPSDPPDFAHEQVRRFVFFTIYSLDRSISSIQGRPLGFRDEAFDIDMPQTPALDVVLADDSAHSYFTLAIARYALHQFKLDRIVSDIKLHLYHLPVASVQFPWPDDPQPQQDRIKAALMAWWESFLLDLSEFSGVDTWQRQVWKLKMSVKLHTAMVLLFQPSQVIRDPAPEALQICFDSASSILRSYQSLYDSRGLQHGWRSVQNIFAAGATLIYSFWTSQIVRKNVSSSHLSQSLRTCSNLLTIGGEWWPSAKKGQISFGAVADLTLQRLYMEEMPNKQRRLSKQKAPTRTTQLNAHAAGLPHPESISGLGMIGSTGDATSLQSGESQHAWPRLPTDSIAPIMNEHENWQNIYPSTLPQDENGDFAPEIETFLADFDRSEFSWSFPLNDLASTDFSMGSFPDSTF